MAIITGNSAVQALLVESTGLNETQAATLMTVTSLGLAGWQLPARGITSALASAGVATRGARIGYFYDNFMDKLSLLVTGWTEAVGRKE
ncbi:MAG: hypothetical protein AAGI44_17870 [Pseudomonadota bacterium]